MERNVVLIASGRHDRGRLFPRTKRQVDCLRELLQKLVGNLNPSDHVAYYDGTEQAKETAERIGLSFDGEKAECNFLGGNARLAPDEFDLGKALQLVEKTPEKNVVLVTDETYLSKFTRLYLARLKKKDPAPGICPGDAVVITDGDSSEGDQGFSVKAISSFAIPIRNRSAATLAE
jgi:hypothetical protein